MNNGMGCPECLDGFLACSCQIKKEAYRNIVRVDGETLLIQIPHKGEKRRWLSMNFFS
jgi:hypothetical protein